MRRIYKATITQYGMIEVGESTYFANLFDAEAYAQASATAVTTNELTWTVTHNTWVAEAADLEFTISAVDVLEWFNE